MKYVRVFDAITVFPLIGIAVIAGVIRTAIVFND